MDLEKPFIVEDAYTTKLLDETLRQLCIQLQVISFIDVPVVKQGKPVGILCITQCTQRKWTEFEKELAVEVAERAWAAVEKAKTEEALQKSEEKYRTLFESIDEGFFIIEVLFDEHDQPIDFFYIEANPSATRMVGQDYTGKRLHDFGLDIESYWYDIFGRVVLTGKSERQEQYAKSFKSWYDFYVFKIGDVDSRRVAVIFKDTTERKRMEQALRDSEQRVQAERQKLYDLFMQALLLLRSCRDLNMFLSCSILSLRK